MIIWIIYQQILILCDIGDCDEAEHMYKILAILHQFERIRIMQQA